MRMSLRERRRWLTAGSLLAAAVSCSESIAPAIEIVLSQPSVDFRAVRGTSAALTRTITVANGGDGRLGPVSCAANPAAWLTCAVSNGNAVTLTANPTGLAASPATAPVQITAAGAPNDPRTVDVHLIIDQPVLTLSTASVAFTAAEGPGGSTTPASATVTVTNTGAGTLANLGTIGCAASPANARIACAVNQGTGVATLSVDAAGLVPGTHVFPVVISAPNDNVSKTVAVTVAVSAIPRLALSPPTLVFQTIRGGGAPAAQTVTVTNSGGGSLGTVSCPASPASWLTCTASGGTLTFAVNPSGLAISPTSVLVPVTATGAVNSPQSVGVTFAIRQPVLAVSATDVAFTAVQGTSATTPTSATVNVTNSGEGTLANLGAIACVPLEGSPVTCTVDQSSGQLTLVVNATGVLGTKLYPVVVSAPNSSVSRTIVVSLTAAPGIALSPNELSFQAIRGTTVDIVKKVKVGNSGGGALGAITCPANPTAWLTCALTVGDTLTFTAKPTGLTASPAEVLVPVSVAGAFNSPQNVTVNFTILQPVLSLDVNLVNRTVAAGGTTTAAVVTVANTGAGTRANLGTISCDPIARVTCTINQGDGTVSITMNTAVAPALTPGQHVIPVTIRAQHMSNGPQTVTFILTVN